MTGLSDHNIILCARKLKKPTPICKFELVPTSQQENLGAALREIEWYGVLSKGDRRVTVTTSPQQLRMLWGPTSESGAKRKAGIHCPGLMKSVGNL